MLPATAETSPASGCVTTPDTLEQPPAASPVCLNCGQELRGAFCAACGQKQTPLNVSLREFLAEAAHELTDWEARIPATLRALWLHPGQLTEDYLAGRRARWVPPLRLYLICSVAFFLTTSLVDAVSHEPDDEVARITIANADGSTSLTPEAREELAEGWPGRIFGVERLEKLATNPETLDEAFVNMVPRAMFVLLPVFALLTYALWRGALRYPAHVYAALHLHAAWFGILAVSAALVAAMPWPPLQVLIEGMTMALVVVYGLRMAKRLFRDSWLRTVAKSIAVSLAYSMCLMLTSLLMLGYLVLTL